MWANGASESASDDRHRSLAGQQEPFARVNRVTAAEFLRDVHPRSGGLNWGVRLTTSGSAAIVARRTERVHFHREYE